MRNDSLVKGPVNSVTDLSANSRRLRSTVCLVGRLTSSRSVASAGPSISKQRPLVGSSAKQSWREV